MRGDFNLSESSYLDYAKGMERAAKSKNKTNEERK